ncbi:aldo/keto reductase [Oceanobacillus alkalisoli]|uniref:aldo/keto reductase n=1 Tax=Oceanobacillus alkalisoli TaxID=2925113 RepID=UPI001F11CD09|nr:aldo/keto reductase [Oceanobacillus alkalisoli]MCF3944404.1 aldo/keto reductase [Oceanobacillus alkalisoli]
MINNLQDTVTLNNGVKMPGFGLGVFKVEDGDTVINAVKDALAVGYRLIDTAAVYENEEGVGKAIKDSGIARDEIFVTSKVWNDQQGYESTLQAFDESLEKLGLDYLDLYLIHWPVSGKYKDTWRALEKLYRDKKVRAIGVSNFHVHHLEELRKDAEVKPVVNQIEFHPHLTQRDVRAYCKEHDIQMQAWSPLKKGRIFDEPLLVQIAEKYGKTVPQVLLRWDLDQAVMTIPKSINKKRMIENADIFDFKLTAEEVEQIAEMNINERTGSNPDDF